MSGTASSQRVAKSNSVRIYLEPSEAQGLIGPTKSTATLSKGESIMGRGCNGAGFTLPLSVVFYIDLHRKSDHTDPMVQTRWPFLKPKWFYNNQMVSKHCISTLVNIKFKEVTVELVFKGVNRVTLDH